MMNTYSPGDKVLFNRGYTDHVATVREAARVDNADGWIIDLAGSPQRSIVGSWFATPDRLVKLPDGTPEFRIGDPVRIDPASPRFAGRRGEACAPEFRMDLFGYWLWLTDPEQRVWMPAAVLTAVQGGGQP